jgi:hypothetical protein
MSSFAQWVAYLIMCALDTASRTSAHAADHFPNGESPPEPDPAYNLVVHDLMISDAHITVMRSAPPEYRYSNVHAAVDDFITVWVALLFHMSAAHILLLQHFQQFVELQEAIQIFGSLSTITAKNLEKKSSDLKMVLQAWQERPSQPTR